MRLLPRNRFKPSSKNSFTGRSNAVLLLRIVLLVMLRVGVCCNVLSVLCSLVVTCWERADLLAIMCVVFCHFPECALVHIRIKGEVGAVKLV